MSMPNHFLKIDKLEKLFIQAGFGGLFVFALVLDCLSAPLDLNPRLPKAFTSLPLKEIMTNITCVTLTLSYLSG